MTNIEAQTILKKIKTNKASDFDLQDLIKFYVINLYNFTIAEELMFKDYIKKAAKQLNIHPKDVMDVYHSFVEQVKNGELK